MTGQATSADPVFQQVAANLRLYALSSRGEASVSGYWAGYRPSGKLSLTPTLTLQTVWQDSGGIYVFCARTPPDAAAFLAALDAWLAASSPRGEVRCLWLADPEAPVSSWAPPRLEAAPAVLPEWVVTKEAAVTVGPYSVIVPAGTTLMPRSGAQSGIWVRGSGLRLRARGADYTCASGVSWLPLLGPGLGAWTSQLRPGADGNPGELAGLGAQLRYTANRSFGGSGSIEARTVPMPVLRPGPGMTCELSFDPLYPLAPGRTCVILRPIGGVPAQLGSNLRTPLGHQVMLTPQGTESPWPARLVLNVSPAGGAGPAGQPDYYLTPDGAFLIGVPQSDPRLALGLSGLEYAELPPMSGICRFVAGQPAFAGDDAVLTATGTTAYLDLLPAGPGRPGLAYFAQPQRAPWYSAGGADGSGFLPALPLATASLPGWPATAPITGNGIPAGCYAGAAAADIPGARWLEDAVLAPARRAQIGGPAPAGPAVSAVTPQGMLATVAAGGAGWDRLVLASFHGAVIPELVFTGVSAAMRGAMAASELFMVIADQDVLRANASVRYRLELADLHRLRLAGLPPEVFNRLDEALRPDYPTFDTEQEFLAAVQPVAGDYLDLILPAAGQLKVTMDDWTFQLSPHSWRSGGKAPTIMLVKLSGRPLADLVAQPAAWTWPEAAGQIPVTQQALADVISAAAAAPAGSPEGRFYQEVAADPRWSGVLFINAPIAVAELPAELRFVAAGIDQDHFYAHHIGFGYTPFAVLGQEVKFGTTAAFGLIRYLDPTELAPTATVPFAFVTQQLDVRFANSTIADLSAQVQLVVNELFGSRLTRVDTVTGNALTLIGSYQRQDGAPGYRFALDSKAVYQTGAAALESVEVLGAAVRTLRSSEEDPLVAVEFALGGNLRFTALPGFDLFSYGPQPAAPPGRAPADGYLRFDDLIVTMAFPAADPSRQVFTTDEGRLRADVASSVPREGSLAAAFPLEVTGVTAVPQPGDGGLRPEDLGYVPVLAPIDQVPLQPPWYGLTMRLDLGSLGPLAGQAGLSATLLAGWMPGPPADGEEGSRPVYCGLRLATAGAIDAGWPVQGVLRVGFRGFEFLVDHSGETPAYLLRLRRLALSVLGWTFPPGQSDVLVFGDPQARRAASVGWYGAYTRENQQ